MLKHRLARRPSTLFMLVAVLPQSVDESQKYLNGLGVSVDDIKQAGDYTECQCANCGLCPDDDLPQTQSDHRQAALLRVRQ